jgi:hypothetical protein
VLLGMLYAVGALLKGDGLPNRGDCEWDVGTAAGAPKVKGTAGPPNVVGMVTGGYPTVEASPDAYPVSIVELGESIPCTAAEEEYEELEGVDV